VQISGRRLQKAASSYTLALIERSIIYKARVGGTMEPDLLCIQRREAFLLSMPGFVQSQGIAWPLQLMKLKMYVLIADSELRGAIRQDKCRSAVL